MINPRVRRRCKKPIINLNSVRGRSFQTLCSEQTQCRALLETVSTKPKKIGGYRRSRLQQYDKRLNQWIKHQSDLTLVQIQQRCKQRLGLNVGINALWHRLNHLGLSYKELYAPPSKTVKTFALPAAKTRCHTAHSYF